ncbi:endo-1,4-beta-xylanase [Gordonia sp. CNJ-863]|uniref:endo-1,4-beta-xylanase n=1 Tax=Gordonia sp. CNJ-863 TaxID=1904963 RepID=UPI0009684AA4|nr:endo-1,4-beta-xylanase [Gordonia sp. CNJ-863]NKR69756.1 endo-1,4-beta-xylanase [Prescottella equi]OLT47429.1 endo-1,4-beta-xylanase [Gordonia sp. CNJ-863]
MSDETEVAETVREPITQSETVLFRPIIRAWAPNGDVTPQAFKLSTADKADSNRLSIAHGDTTAEDAYNERADAVKKRCDENNKPYRAPVGVLAVTVDDVESIEIKSPEGSEARRPLTAWDDSMNDHIPDTHGHIDYDNLPPSDRGAYDFAAKALLNRAKKNGWKFGPFDE